MRFHRAEPLLWTATACDGVSVGMADRAIDSVAQARVLLETGCVPAYAVIRDADGVR